MSVLTFKDLGVLFWEKAGRDTHTKYALQHKNTAFGAWYHWFACDKVHLPVRLMMVRMFVYSAVTYCSSSWDLRNDMGVKWMLWHAKPCMQFSRYIWTTWLGRFCLGMYGCFLHHWLYIFQNWCGSNKSSSFQRNDGFRLGMTFVLKVLEAWDALELKRSWCQSVADILSNIKHNSNIEFPEQAAHA